MARGLRLPSTARTKTKETESVSIEVSRVSIGFVAILGGLVGLWSLACIVAGFGSSGGPLHFIRDWWRAVSGM